MADRQHLLDGRTLTLLLLASFWFSTNAMAIGGRGGEGAHFGGEDAGFGRYVVAARRMHFMTAQAIACRASSPHRKKEAGSLATTMIGMGSISASRRSIPMNTRLFPAGILPAGNP